jgi:hypothetical protein
MNADGNQVSLPQTVSRYFRDKDYSYDSFANGRLWVSNATEFNDPFDVLPAFGNVADQITEQQRKIHFAFSSPRGPGWNEYQKRTKIETESVQREMTELGPHLLKASFTNKNGVICFAAKPDNAVMWAHYASDHQGFVLEFDVSHRFFRAPFFRRVEYPDTEARPRADDLDRHRTVCTKGTTWKDEAEFRLILPRDSSKLLDGHYVELPTEAVKAVYFGCRMSTAGREKLLNVLLQPKYKNVLAYQMFPDTSLYRLIAEAWSDSVRERADFLFKLECATKEALNSPDFYASLQALLEKRF